MLNKDIRKILSKLSTINDSMIISWPVTLIKAGKTIQAFVNLEKLGETQEFNEFGVLSINEFDSVVNCIDDAEIQNKNGTLEISNGVSSLLYNTSNIEILEDTCRGNFNLLTAVTSSEKIVEFEMTAKELQSLRKTAQLLGLTDISIIGDSGEINVTAAGIEKSTNSFTVKKESVFQAPFNVILKMDMINKLPNIAYKIGIYKSEKSGAIKTVFTSVDFEGLDILVPSRAESGI